MAKPRQYCEVSAANCRKPCFITPFMEAGTLSQPLLPAGQFSRRRPSGRFPAPARRPGGALTRLGPPPDPTRPRPLPPARPGPARRPPPNVPALARPGALRQTHSGRAEQPAPLVPHLRTPRRRRAVRGRGKPGGRQGPGDAAARTQASPLRAASLTPAAGRADAHAG